jgi:hypothetical protein
MTSWARPIRLGLAAIFGLAVGAEGIYTSQNRSSGQEGFVAGIVIGFVLSLVGVLIFYSQLRYENKLGRATAGNGIGQSDALGSRVLVGVGSFFIGLGHLAFVASALYLAVVAFSMYSGGGVSGIPLAVGLFGGAFCYLIGDAFKKSG